MESLVRNVKKGEQAICILAPITGKCEDEKDGQTVKMARVVAFRCARFLMSHRPKAKSYQS